MSTYTYRYIYTDEHGVKQEGEAKGTFAQAPEMRSDFGEGWPYPKRTRRAGTVYRVYSDVMQDLHAIIANDQDGTTRGIEIAGQIVAAVLRPRALLLEAGARLWNEDDWETLLQAEEAWTTAAPGVVVGKLEAIPSLQTLAAALFKTHPDVAAFVERVSDWKADASCCPPDHVGPCARCDAQAERFSRAMLRAWDRNENGWRTGALERAELVLQALASK